MTQVLQAEIVEDMLELPAPIALSGQALESLVRGEVDIQVSTAMKYGRNVTACMDEAKSLATITPEVAESCYYALPRAGKTLQGPSVRLAEIMCQSWRHMRVQANIVGQDQSFVTARAVAWDLYKNVAVATEVRRRITDKHGNTFKEDMIQVASQAALAIATRNAIFSVIPQSITQEVYRAALQTAAGQAIPLAQRREKALQWFEKQGISRDRVFAFMEVGGQEDMTADDIARLGGVCTGLKEGALQLEDVFPSPEPEAAPEKEKKGKAKKDAEPAGDTLLDSAAAKE